MMPPVYNPETAVLTSRYKRWYRKQPCKTRRHIRYVLGKVGTINSSQVKCLEDALWELKPNSYRIYFGVLRNTIYILDGSSKDLQKKLIPEMMKKWNIEKRQAQLPSG